MDERKEGGQSNTQTQGVQPPRVITQSASLAAALHLMQTQAAPPLATKTKGIHVAAFLMNINTSMFPTLFDDFLIVPVSPASARPVFVRAEVEKSVTRESAIWIHPPSVAAICQEMEDHAVTVEEWKVLKQHMLAALVACGIITAEGRETHAGLMFGTLDGTNMSKLIQTTSKPRHFGGIRMDDALPMSDWVWTKDAKRLAESGLLPWRCHTWDMTEEVFEGEVPSSSPTTTTFAVVEFVQLRPQPTREAAARCKDGRLQTHLESNHDKLDAMFKTLPRVWFVPHTGSWWTNLRTALRQHRFSAKDATRMQDPAFAPFV